MKKILTLLADGVSFMQDAFSGDSVKTYSVVDQEYICTDTQSMYNNFRVDGQTGAVYTSMGAGFLKLASSKENFSNQWFYRKMDVILLENGQTCFYPHTKRTGAEQYQTGVELVSASDLLKEGLMSEKDEALVRKYIGAHDLGYTSGCYLVATSCVVEDKAMGLIPSFADMGKIAAAEGD